MKVVLESFGEKKVSYKIYDFDGKKRKLLTKGKFSRRAETEIEDAGARLIVRVQRRNGFVAFWAAVYVAIANFFLVPGRHGFYESMAKHLSLYPFEEIRLTDYGGETIRIQYQPSPLTRMVYGSNRPEKTLIVEYLTCPTHGYIGEDAGRKAANKVFYTLAFLFWLALLAAVCLIVRFFILRK